MYRVYLDLRIATERTLLKIVDLVIARSTL